VRTGLEVGRGEEQQDGRARPREDVCDSLDLGDDRAVEGHDRHTPVQGTDLDRSFAAGEDNLDLVLVAV